MKLDKMSEWIELKVGEWPENCKIYCACGAKNRSDEGWRYRKSTQHAARAIQAEAMLRKMTFPGPDGTFGGLTPAKHEYQCATCRLHHGADG